MSVGDQFLTYENLSEALESVPIPLPKSLISKLPNRQIDRRTNDACPICMEDFLIGDDVWILPCCERAIHSGADPSKFCSLWFNKSCKCPCCRQDLREVMNWEPSPDEPEPDASAFVRSTVLVQGPSGIISRLRREEERAGAGFVAVNVDADDRRRNDPYYADPVADSAPASASASAAASAAAFAAVDNRKSQERHHQWKKTSERVGSGEAIEVPDDRDVHLEEGEDGQGENEEIGEVDDENEDDEDDEDEDEAEEEEKDEEEEPQCEDDPFVYFQIRLPTDTKPQILRLKFRADETTLNDVGMSIVSRLRRHRRASSLPLRASPASSTFGFLLGMPDGNALDPRNDGDGFMSLGVLFPVGHRRLMVHLRDRSNFSVVEGRGRMGDVDGRRIRKRSNLRLMGDDPEEQEEFEESLKQREREETKKDKRYTRTLIRGYRRSQKMKKEGPAKPGWWRENESDIPGPSASPAFQALVDPPPYRRRGRGRARGGRSRRSRGRGRAGGTRTRRSGRGTMTQTVSRRARSSGAASQGSRRGGRVSPSSFVAFSGSGNRLGSANDPTRNRGRRGARRRRRGRGRRRRGRGGRGGSPRGRSRRRRN